MSKVVDASALLEIVDVVTRIGRLCINLKNLLKKKKIVVEELECPEKALEDLQPYARVAKQKQSNDELDRKWLKDPEKTPNHPLKFGHQRKRLDRAPAGPQKTVDEVCQIGLPYCQIGLPYCQIGLPYGALSVQGSSSQASGLSNRGALMVEPVLYGHEEEKRMIIEELLSYNDGDPAIGVLPIVGMGGIGKTTIAQHVFNDDRVKEFFEVRSWSGVSRDYDMFSVMKGLVDFMAGNPRNESESGVQNQLMEELTGKKFLIVLDDLWNEKKMDWDILTAAFRGGSCGSKVIVTTRSEHVADMARTVKRYWKLEPLPFEGCWKVFCSKVGGSLDERKEEVGKEIVRRCYGLPLAAAIFGGLLRNKENLQYWEDVRDIKSWKSKEAVDDLRSVMSMGW